MAPEPLPAIPPNLLAKLQAMQRDHARLEAELADPSILVDHRAVRDRSMKKSAIEPVVAAFSRYQSLSREMDDLISAASQSQDPDLAAMAGEDIPRVRGLAARTLEQVKRTLVSSDTGRVGSVMLEVRAGTGGDEAAIWARDLLDMYQRLATRRKWAFETLDATPEPQVDGVRAAVVNIRGENVWSELGFEAGVHSVKRVPATEAQGRIHTSTATVAVLPEPEEVDVKIDWANDVNEDVTTSQGPGGQNVNKVATAVKLFHKPTGIEVRMQESKSQQQNREKARRLLMARVYELERQKQHRERTAARNAQIGSGERSEKIRTYRYKEGIVADERLPGQYSLRDMLAGNLDVIIADLTEQETTRRLAAL
jgi:peptide chain release factor 1